MSQIYVPATSPDDWKQFLKDPDKHWKTGFSAKTLAYCWHEASGLPQEIQQLFASADAIPLRDLHVLLAIPEWITPIAGKGEFPHSDVFVLAKAADGHLASITVEGKVDEPFGDRNQPVGRWKVDGDVENRQTGLDFLLGRLSLAENAAENIVYQLVQRTASAVAEAEKFNAKYAVMIVHSFSPTHSNWDVFQRFVAAFDHPIEPGQLVEISRYNSISILVGWAQGDQRYLSM